MARSIPVGTTHDEFVGARSNVVKVWTPGLFRGTGAIGEGRIDEKKGRENRQEQEEECVCDGHAVSAVSVINSEKTRSCSSAHRVQS